MLKSLLGKVTRLLSSTEWGCWPFCHSSVFRTWSKHSLPREEMESCVSGLRRPWWRQCFWCTVASFAFALLWVPLRTRTSASPRSGRRQQVLPLLGKVLLILRNRWGKVRRREELFVVLPLGRPFCTILVDAVKVEQRCARHPVRGCHIHFPWRPQPHGWWHLRLCFQPGEQHMVEKIVLDV